MIGVNAVDYSGYPDCRPHSCARSRRSPARHEGRAPKGDAWRVHAPLRRLSKAEIVRRAVAWGVPYAATISCYDPGCVGGAVRRVRRLPDPRARLPGGGVEDRTRSR